MEKSEIVNIIVTGITYLSPLVVIIWKLAKADSKINLNEKKIGNIQNEIESQQLYQSRIMLIEQKLSNIEANALSEKKRTDKVESTLSEIKEDLRGVSSKLDMLLKYNINAKG